MSVVNTVLRDLDARRAGANERVGVPSAVTPLSVHLARSQSAPWRKLLGVGVALSILVGVGSAAWLLRTKSADHGASAGAGIALVKVPPVGAAVPAVSAPLEKPVEVTKPVENQSPTLPIAGAEKVPAVSKPLEAIVAPTSVAVAKPAATKSAPKRESEVRSTTGHYLQVGAFASSENAKSLREQLQRDLGPLGEKVLVIPAGRLSLVQLGPWSDVAEARRAADTLREKIGIASAPVIKAQRGNRESLATTTELAPLSPETKGAAVVTAVAASTQTQSALPSMEESEPAPTTPMPSKIKGGKPVPQLGDGQIDKQSRLPTAIERAEATYLRAILIQRQGQLDDAAALFRAALEDNPEHPAARQTLAGLLIDSKRYDEAEELLRKGVDIPAARLPSVLALARLKVERNQGPAALELLQQYGHVGERSADYQGFTGALLNRMGKHREASDRYQVAAQLAPAEARWWAALGIALEAQGRTTEARDAYQKARNLPNLPAELSQHIEQRLR